MEREKKIIEQLKSTGLLPLFYHDNIDTCKALVSALYVGGVRCIEFTNRGAFALSNFRELIKYRDLEMKDLMLAIGTIKTAEQAKKFVDAGADFLISPFFDHAICNEAHIQKTTWIPGCMTPTEIRVAEQAGCAIIKLFPGNTLGPGFVEAILPLFPALNFIVTGGVDTNEDNLQKWFKAGVAAVGMGSKLISKEMLQQNDYNGLTNKTTKLISIIQNIKTAE